MNEHPQKVAKLQPGLFLQVASQYLKHFFLSYQRRTTKRIRGRNNKEK